MSKIETRIKSAKTFLQREMTQVKLGSGRAHLDLHQIGHHLDTIHEAERTGVRNLSDIQEVRLQRVLTTLEDLMNYRPSDN